jgi:uncharacterized 2Fe-2S/4Fe-4S cluster protein (DUF4445 family)
MKLEIKAENHSITVDFLEGDSLLDVLTKHGYDINAVCGGNGSCFKCKVRVLYPYHKPSERELTAFTAEEIDAGIRLACDIKPVEDTGIELLSNGKMEVLQTSVQNEGRANTDGTVRVVIDIGTTTLVAALIDENACVIGTVGEKNKQAAFGADVIARVKYVANGGLKELQGVVTGQINSMLRNLIDTYKIRAIEDITVCANTAMLHLFFGRDCSGLGFYPYTADFLGSQSANGIELGVGVNVPVRSLPCIASFAGADLTAGIVSEFKETEKYALLIDLGTNAEVALFNNQKIFVSSAAAGPAFEGASIKQGMGAVPGAICSYELVNGNSRVKTINNKVPAGICGSGLIDIVAELLKNNLIEDTGLLLTGKSYELSEEVSIYAEDIRELQLAKAAIAAAIDMLIVSAGLEADDIERVLISGGFGSFINPGNAALIGLFPAELRKKTAAVGNSSLAGGILCAAFPEKMALAEKIAASTEYVDLTSSVEFSQRYVEHMMF